MGRRPASSFRPLLRMPNATLPRPRHGASRVGFTASRKVGIAVERNRARRRLRAAFERVLPLHAARGMTT